MKAAFTLLILVVLSACATKAPKGGSGALPSFQDTYRWHAYHLTREVPKSEDGMFQLIGVSKEGSAEVYYVHGEKRIVVKKNPSKEELAESRMPMRVTKSDFETQSVDFEWLTTN